MMNARRGLFIGAVSCAAIAVLVVIWSYSPTSHPIVRIAGRSSDLTAAQLNAANAPALASRSSDEDVVLRVVDNISRKEQIGLRVFESANRANSFVTPIMKLPRHYLRDNSLFLELPAELGERVVPIRHDFIAEIDSCEFVVLVPIFARLSLAIDGSFVGPISILITKKEAPNDGRRVGASPGAPIQRNLTSIERHLDTLLPILGTIEVTVTASGCLQERRLIRLCPGETTNETITLRSTPYVRGRLFDASGTPLQYAPLTIGTWMTVSVSDSRSERLFSQAHSYYRRMPGKNGDEFEVVVHSSGKTNDMGYYDISVPFTSRVCAWSFVRGRGSVIEFKDVPSPDESVEGFDLRLGEAAKIQMSVTNSSGEPLRNFELSVVADSPKEIMFGVRYPILQSNERGIVDASDLFLGTKYIILGPKRVGSKGDFVCRKGGEIVVQSP